MSAARDKLKEVFGYEAFRPGQEEAVEATLRGRDVLAVMPTGAGKSVCYQIPALLLPGITLVISPLISLMRDQVGALTQNGVPAAYLNSSLTPRQHELALRNAREGRYRIIYVAPERLTSQAFLDFALGARIAQIVVDEAHCVSQWGQDFRPGYLNIAPFIARFEKRPPVSAFTATATRAVRRDIVELLHINYDGKLRIFESIIPISVRAAETSAEGRSIYLHDPAGKVAVAYTALTREVMEYERQCI